MCYGHHVFNNTPMKEIPMSEVKSKVINGVAFEISQPYVEGHALTAAEAKALNQVRSENIGNNVREKVKELIDSGNETEARSLVAEKDASYIFTLASVSTATKLDPVEREARAIAKEIVKSKLAETGRKITVVPDGETKESWAEKIEANIDRIATNEGVLKEAKKAVDAKKKRLENLSGVEF
jgi:hypothetical protein